MRSHLGILENSLGIGFLEQGRPELVRRLRLTEQKPAISGGQFVVDDHVHPMAAAPELEVKYAGIGSVRLPFLFHVIRYHLQEGRYVLSFAGMQNT